MGTTLLFRCRNCGLEAEVSGGKDVGFLAETQTVYCPVCQALRDVIVKFWARDELGEPLPSWLTGNELGRCPVCECEGGRAWSRGLPCPRCGGKVECLGVVELWD